MSLNNYFVISDNIYNIQYSKSIILTPFDPEYKKEFRIPDTYILSLDSYDHVYVPTNETKVNILVIKI